MITVEHYRSEKRLETLSKLIKIISLNEDSYEEFIPLFVRLLNKSSLSNIDRVIIGFIINNTNLIISKDRTNILNFRLKNYKEKGISGLIFEYDEKLLIKIIEKVKFGGTEKNN
jgi:hypothetical protein